VLFGLVLIADGEPQVGKAAMEGFSCVGELFGLAALVGELALVEPGEGELGLRCRIGLSDSPRHADGFLKALGGERPVALIQSPFAA
jgi:hypothetical protein